jgi:hypothetical protein
MARALTEGAVDRPRRGRPLSMPFDPTPWTEAAWDPWPRTAWLLVTSRLLAPDPDLGQREVVVERLRAHGVAVDASRASRWESGRHPVPGRVLLAYETILGLPPASLLATARALVRSCGSPSDDEAALGWEVADRRDSALLDELVDRGADPSATTGAAMTGQDWLRLALELTQYDSVYLGPRMWSALSERLVSEMARSSGPGQLSRFEAGAVLVRHPAAQRHLLRALGQWVMDPDVQRCDPMMSLLAEVGDAPATQLAVKLLGSGQPAVVGSALVAVAAKLARGHVNSETMRLVERSTVRHVLDDPGSNLRMVDVLDQLPSASSARMVSQVRDPAAHTRLERVLAERSLVPERVGQATSRSVADRVQSTSTRDYHAHTDRQLQALVHESLFHVQGLRRRLGARVLALSPFAPALTESCLELAASNDPVVAASAFRLAGQLGSADHADRLFDVAIAETRTGVQLDALTALSERRAPLTVGQTAHVTGLIDATESVHVRATALAVVGMRAPRQVLAAAAGSDDLRGAALWWDKLGGPITD